MSHAGSSSKAARHRRTAEPRERLDRARIAAAALEQIDSHGLEGLSMRNLGAALGVEAMALYHYFDSKGALLDAVTEILLEKCVLQGPALGEPIERIEAALRAYRQVAISHPRAFALLTTRRFSTAAAFAYYEQILAPYFDAGFDAKMAARLFRLGGYFAGGAGHAEIASRALQADATPLVLQDAREELEQFPRVARVAPHLRLENLDDIFEFGLRVVIEATKNAPRKSRPTVRRPRL